MALQFSEGFDAYSSLADLSGSGKYQQVAASGSNPSFSNNSGKFGGRALITNGAGYASSLRFTTNIAAGATFYVGGWWKLTTFGGFVPGQWNLINPSGLGLIGTNFSGYLTLNNNTSTALATGTTYIGDGYHWIEGSFLLNGASSQVSLYVDGLLQFSGTYNLSAFPSQAITTFWMGTGSASGSVPAYLDDFLIWDNSGTTFNTFPLGPRRIGLMNPNAAGDSTQFTPSQAASNYSMVSLAVQSWGSTTNVSDTGTGNVDLYKMSVLPYTPATTINAVVVNVQAYNPGGDGAHSISPKLKSGTIVASGPSTPLTATGVVYQGVFPKDSSGNTWTLTNLNAAQAGIGD